MVLPQSEHYWRTGQQNRRAEAATRKFVEAIDTRHQEFLGHQLGADVRLARVLNLDGRILRPRW